MLSDKGNVIGCLCKLGKTLGQSLCKKPPLCFRGSLTFCLKPVQAQDTASRDAAIAFHITTTVIHALHIVLTGFLDPSFSWTHLFALHHHLFSPGDTVEIIHSF